MAPRNWADSALLCSLWAAASWPPDPHQATQILHPGHTPVPAGHPRSAVCYWLLRLKRPCLARRDLGSQGLKSIKTKRTEWRRGGGFLCTSMTKRLWFLVNREKRMRRLDANKLNYNQLELDIVLMYNQILWTNTERNVWRSVRRINISRLDAERVTRSSHWRAGLLFQILRHMIIQYLPCSVTGCRSQGLIRSTSPVSHLKTHT